jgi:hemerythrin-like domain-containing protein
MGYDITFHPIKPKEITRYIFEIIENPDLVSERIRELTTSADEQERLKLMYSEFLDLTRDKTIQHVKCPELHFHAAIISSYLHPFWYTRFHRISYYIDCNYLENCFHSIIPYCPTKIANKFRDEGFLIEENYMASGYAPHEVARNICDTIRDVLEVNIENLENDRLLFINKNNTWVNKIKRFIKLAPKETIFPEEESLNTLRYSLEQSDFLWALNNLQNYCRENDTGFIEASDFFVPFAGECYGDIDNLIHNWNSSKKEQ